jgi:hypothetical protein
MFTHLSGRDSKLCTISVLPCFLSNQIPLSKFYTWNISEWNKADIFLPSLLLGVAIRLILTSEIKAGMMCDSSKETFIKDSWRVPLTTSSSLSHSCWLE